MDSAAYILVRFAVIFVKVILWAMFIRCIVSFFHWGQEDGGPLLGLLCFVTEPIILPVRMLCQRFGWFENIPVDVPFMITFFLLEIFANVLSYL